MAKTSEPVETDIEDGNPYAGRPRNLETFFEALGRGFSRAMRGGFFRNNVFLGAAKSSIGTEISGARRAIRKFKMPDLAAEAMEAQAFGPSLYLDVQDETIEVYIRNAKVAWGTGVGIGFCGMAMFAYPVIQGLISISRYNTCLSGVCLACFGASKIVRSARDIEVMTTRRPLPLDQFLARFGELWCPFPANSWQRNLVMWLVLPTAALAFFFYPAIVQMGRLLGLA